MKMRALLIALALAASSLTIEAQLPATQGGTLGFYRFPALNGDVIVFAAEGDLWRVSATGGVAHRLTTHAAEETDPVLSPDGQTIAFTARYEGPAELYTMPVTGGMPVRHTYEAERSTATTWTRDGRIVYTTSHYSTLPQAQLVALDPATDSRERVPLFTASEGEYDDSGNTLFFVRPAFHNNVTKRYVGGTARDVWKFEAGAAEAVELTGDYEGESHSPMYWQGRVYFVSDRDGTMNLWSMDTDGGDVRQHTHHAGWDVKSPAAEGGRVVYELAGNLRLFDVVTGADAVVPITLASDFEQLREKWVDDPMDYLSSAHLDAEGEKVVLTARGRVFVASADGGRIVRASKNDGARYRDVVFMPDGGLVGLSDESGEMEWVTLAADGVGAGRSLTNDGTTHRFAGVVSPDGRWLSYTDNNSDLWVLDVQSGERTLVSQDKEGGGGASWSPDSKWLAYQKVAANSFVQIKLYGVEGGARADVTSDRVNSGFPSWDPKGDFLYFLSDRNLQSLVGGPWGPRQPEPYFDRQLEIYHVSLRPGLRSPFERDDELSAGGGENGDSSSMAPGPANPIVIDLSGLERRARRVPVRAGNYNRLGVNDGTLFFLDRDAGQQGGSRLTAVAITKEELKLTVITENVNSFELSENGKKMLVRQGRNLHIIDAKAAAVSAMAEHRLDLSDWTFPIDVREDFREIFVDLWRQERDWFYDPNMHGVDWEGVRDKYLALVDRVTTRDELNDVIGRVVGELSALHTAVRGGDLRSGDDNIQVATLGARIVRTSAGDRIDYIYQSDPDYPAEMSPLADPDLAISEGDVIEAVNGVEVLSTPDIGALLRNTAGDLVRLRIRSGSNAPREVMVTPTTQEAGIRYADWEYTRRLAVEEQGDRDIGYVHLRAMGGNNLTEWYRQFYPVHNRAGLIIDVRQNRGGNIDSFILEKLMRQAWMYFKGRTGDPTWNMQYAFRGHMVVLVDQMTASDGEVFADGFRRLGLGEVIGMRTWGGEIWLSNNTLASDGGLARTPQTGVYGPEGEWLIEQIGFIPDIEVDNLPHQTFNGEDAQLDAAIQYLQQKIAEDPRAVPAPPPHPNRGFPYRVAPDGGRGGSGGR